MLPQLKRNIFNEHPWYGQEPVSLARLIRDCFWYDFAVYFCPHLLTLVAQYFCQFCEC